MSERDKVIDRLRCNYSRILAECEQAIIDIDSWNANRTEHPPLDGEWFKVTAAGLRKCLAALDRGEPIQKSWLPKE
jgi:hypothetical protein